MAFLRAQAVRADPKDDYGLEGWQLHAHPDLVEFVETKIFPSGQMVSAYGVPAVVVNGVVAAVAIGSSVLLLRLPEPPAYCAWKTPDSPLDERGWYTIDAWQDPLSRLRLLADAALRYATELA